MKLRKDDIYAAPPIEAAVPPSVENLSELLRNEGESALLLFSLGNVLLREGRFAEAAQSYKRAFELGEYAHELLTNSGVTAIRLENLEEGLSLLRQAILLSPQRPLPFLHSARVQRELKDFDGAKQSFEKLLRLTPNSVEALVSLAEIAEIQGDHELSEKWYRQAFELDPAAGGSRARLAIAEFEKGKALVRAGKLEEGFQIWAEANKHFAPAFSVEQPLVSGLQVLAKEFEQAGGTQDLEQRLLADWFDANQRRKLTYQMVLRSLFVFGLIPDCFENEATLATELARWQESLIRLGEHPYPHFRIGLIYLYRGDVSDAESEIRLCQDKLLPKKHAALKLEPILGLLNKFKDIETLAVSGNIAQSPDYEWEAAGFGNVFERNSWKQAGILPTDAKAWKENGFSAVKAKLWIGPQIPPPVAKVWSDAGAVHPERVKRWIRARVEPEIALEWEKHFQDNVEQAIQCKNVGLEDPELARRWMDVVLFPWDAIRWHEQGFSPEEARSSLNDGVRDPIRAKELGYRKKDIVAPGNDLLD